MVSLSGQFAQSQSVLAVSIILGELSQSLWSQLISMVSVSLCGLSHSQWSLWNQSVPVVSGKSQWSRVSISGLVSLSQSIINIKDCSEISCFSVPSEGSD